MSAAWLIVLCYLLVAGGLWWWVQRERGRFRRSLSEKLRLEGKEGEAEILARHRWDVAELMRQMPTGSEEAEVDEQTVGITRDGRCYVLEYRLEALSERQTHHFFRKCQPQEWRAARVGDYVAAVYWPENIALHQLRLSGGLPRAALAIGLFWVLMAMLPFL